VEADPPALTVLVIVLHMHMRDGRDTSKGIDHQRNECSVTEAHHVGDVNAVQEHARVRGREHRRLATLITITRAFDARCGIERQLLADHHPVKEHPDRCQVLLHGLWRAFLGQEFNVGRDDHRLDGGQLSTALLTPRQKLLQGASIGGARVRVPDVSGEEFQEALSGALAFTRDDLRDDQTAGGRVEGYEIGAHRGWNIAWSLVNIKGVMYTYPEGRIAFSDEVSMRGCPYRCVRWALTWMLLVNSA